MAYRSLSELVSQDLLSPKASDPALVRRMVQQSYADLALARLAWKEGHEARAASITYEGIREGI